MPPEKGINIYLSFSGAGRHDREVQLRYKDMLTLFLQLVFNKNYL